MNNSAACLAGIEETFISKLRGELKWMNERLYDLKTSMDNKRINFFGTPTPSTVAPPSSLINKSTDTGWCVELLHLIGEMRDKLSEIEAIDRELNKL